MTRQSKLIESAVLGVAGLLAFTIVAVIVYAFGLVFNFRSLSLGFKSEVLLIRDFPLFFILVALIKILIGGDLIDRITRLLSKAFNIDILVDRGKRKH